MLILKKLVRDIAVGPWRTLAIVLATAVGLSGFFAVTGAYGILAREINRNYLDSKPASFTLMLDRATPELLNAAVARPEVAAATRRKTLLARYRTSAATAWGRAPVFIVDDFGHPGVAELLHQEGLLHSEGQATPPLGDVLIERSAVSQLGIGVREFELQFPGAEPRRVNVAGVVHEPALAPAKSEQAVYLYMTAQTAQRFDPAFQFDELRVLVRQDPGDLASIEAKAEALATWVQASGLAQVHSIRVPPPFKHPHQNQLIAVLTLFVIFSGVIFLLSALLGATLLNTWLARQVREIGVLKSLGARTLGLLLAYGGVVSFFSLSALAVAWLPGKLGALRLANNVASVLNFDLGSLEVPGAILGLQLGLGASLPLLLGLPRVVRTCRTSVRAALLDFGLPTRARAGTRLERWLLQSLSRLPMLVGYVLRGMLRRRRQFALSWGLLVVAGAGVIGAVSLAQAWDTLLDDIDRTRHYTLEVHLDDDTQSVALARRLAQLPSVGAVEIWRNAPIALGRPGHPAIERTYPDESHGAFRLIAVPDDARLLQVDLSAGQWLTTATEERAVVINQLVPGFDSLPLGGELLISIAGQMERLRVVGKARQVGVGAAAYVTARSFRELVPSSEQNTDLWLAQRETSSPLAPFIAELEQELTNANAAVRSIVPVSMVKNAMAAHFEILIYSLLALAGLMSIVGALGLGSALGVSVSERTRELGVLRAIGAKPRDLRNSVLLEGLLVSALSIGVAVLLGLGIELLVGSVVGRLSFRIPLPAHLSLLGTLGWVALALGLALLGGLAPALSAGKLRLRDALVWLVLLLSIGAALRPLPVHAAPAHGTLNLVVKGFEHARGRVVVKLFRESDGPISGAGYRKAVQTVELRGNHVAFTDIPWGRYAVFAFHDENGNDQLDHNLLGIPSEPLGFSNGFRPTLFSGVPKFGDLAFTFGPDTAPKPILLKAWSVSG